MYRFFRLLPLMILSCALGACALNQVRLLPEGAAPQVGAAVVVYGVSVEGEWKLKSFGVQLDQYDIARQKITGDCFRFDRMVATAPSVPGVPSYFAFEVPAGYYVYSGFNRALLTQNPGAFAAPEAQIVYIGDFVLGRDGNVVLHRDLDSLKAWPDSRMRNLKGAIALADTLPAGPPNLFMCTP